MAMLFAALGATGTIMYANNAISWRTNENNQFMSLLMTYRTGCMVSGNKFCNAININNDRIEQCILGSNKYCKQASVQYMTDYLNTVYPEWRYDAIKERFIYQAIEKDP